ncbi:class I glutamine amidotransferase-like protein [Artomyces pyxidatus]|uniref:Class I glutamine amidotransferase-like protein n=2 Tax=Artomyces pyxidatus TaxID=48021 RepID=A0ACB8TC81_9AGAM|nr:class I glutamine amidotransferase-like protein [Artomyces pyxidatus]
MSRILFVFTSVSKTLLGNPTGWYLPEAAHPYYVLAPHFPIDFAAPHGPNPPIDQSSVENFKDEDSTKFLVDPTVQSLLANATLLDLKNINVNDYAAIFYVGGHGPVLDLATDASNIAVANEFYRSGKIVSAVCHGPAALVGVTSSDGKSIFDGNAATAFSNAEEEKVGRVKDIPFLAEDRIVSLGGTFEKAPELFAPKVVRSGTLITGQNPASAKPIGEEILKALQTRSVFDLDDTYSHSIERESEKVEPE